EPLDGLVDECVDSLIQTVSRLRDRERFHAPIVPNTCSPLRGQCAPRHCLATAGSNTSGVAGSTSRPGALQPRHDFEDSGDDTSAYPVAHHLNPLELPRPASTR